MTHDLKRTWNNRDNMLFYEAISLDFLYEAAIDSGFDTGCDINLIINYIENASSILDIGAGYGRALTHIICTGFTGKLCGVERTKKSYQFMHSQLWRRAELIHADIREVELSSNFDLILCLWATFPEFTKEEQISLIKKFEQRINPGGHFIIDNMTVETQLYTGKQIDSYTNVLEAKVNHSIERCYDHFPSSSEIAQYAKEAGLQLTAQIPYTTNSNFKHVLYVLSK